MREMSFSSSSSRTPSDRNVGRMPVKEESLGDYMNLDQIEIPNLSSNHSFDFLDEESVEGEVCVTSPLSPQTVARRQKFVVDASVAGSAELADKPNLNYASVFVNRPLDVDIGIWVDLENNYECKVPLARDRIWMMPYFGVQWIPMVRFELGLRLPMHPFHLAIFEELGCGVSQLTPNSVAQVSGFIARCVEMGYVPSIRLFFSNFGIKYARGQVYFEKIEREVEDCRRQVFELGVAC